MTAVATLWGTKMKPPGVAGELDFELGAEEWLSVELVTGWLPESFVRIRRLHGMTQLQLDTHLRSSSMIPVNRAQVACVLPNGYRPQAMYAIRQQPVNDPPIGGRVQFTLIFPDAALCIYSPDQEIDRGGSGAIIKLL